MTFSAGSALLLPLLLLKKNNNFGFSFSEE
jgi:hypothetical protein